MRAFSHLRLPSDGLDVDAIFAPSCRDLTVTRSGAGTTATTGPERASQPLRSAAAAVQQARNLLVSRTNADLPGRLSMAERQTFTPPELERRIGDAWTCCRASDVDHIRTDALLFQAGYLTLSKVEQILPGEWLYTWATRNQEVRTSLNKALLPCLGLGGSRGPQHRCSCCIASGTTISPAASAVHGLLRQHPERLKRKPHHANYEGYYASVFYNHFAALGLTSAAGPSRTRGRIDMKACCSNGQVYLFKFKVVEDAPEPRAAADQGQGGHADK